MLLKYIDYTVILKSLDKLQRVVARLPCPNLGLNAW